MEPQPSPLHPSVLTIHARGSKAKSNTTTEGLHFFYLPPLLQLAAVLGPAPARVRTTERVNKKKSESKKKNCFRRLLCFFCPPFFFTYVYVCVYSRATYRERKGGSSRVWLPVRWERVFTIADRSESGVWLYECYLP
ncbi:hypothetical protein DFP73DRAFT_539973 [Morchella snyderi]|nr:hypothetical protein DFP73DRAFT_539973 [Morchella snyderi]